MRNRQAGHAARVSPIVGWGIGIGLLIVVVDTVSALAARGLTPESEPAQYIDLADQLANVALYSLVGLRVGRVLKSARAAAEAGVIAGVLAGAAAILLPLIVPDGLTTAATAQRVIGTLAFNVAMGGILAHVNGWLASRPKPGSAGPPNRPRGR